MLADSDINFENFVGDLYYFFRNLNLSQKVKPSFNHCMNQVKLLIIEASVVQHSVPFNKLCYLRASGAPSVPCSLRAPGVPTVPCSLMPLVSYVPSVPCVSRVYPQFPVRCMHVPGFRRAARSLHAPGAPVPNIPCTLRAPDFLHASSSLRAPGPPAPHSPCTLPAPDFIRASSSLRAPGAPVLHIPCTLHAPWFPTCL